MLTTVTSSTSSMSYLTTVTQLSSTSTSECIISGQGDIQFRIISDANGQIIQNANVNVADAIGADLTNAAQKTGENVRLGKTAVLSNSGGKVGLYIYSISGKIGVLLSFSGNIANLTDELITDIGGHIAFARPLALNRESLPADLVAKEKEIAVEQAKALGKPQPIAEKIAEGKMQAFYAERTLLDQRVQLQTMSEAFGWVWKGYTPSGK